jgi:hypothetical protein
MMTAIMRMRRSLYQWRVLLRKPVHVLAQVTQCCVTPTGPTGLTDRDNRHTDEIEHTDN